jgi:hypothetical protein
LIAKTWMAGHRRAEATPFYERLCPAMTMEPTLRCKGCGLLFFIIFVDAIFTTLFGALFTNAFDVIGENAAICCV